MNTEIIIHAADYSVEKDSLKIYIEKNLAGKMDAYIKKYAKDDSVVRVELTVEKENDKQHTGKLAITLGNESYRSKRENFDNLADLVNHLFDHIKTQLSK